MKTPSPAYGLLFLFSYFPLAANFVGAQIGGWGFYFTHILTLLLHPFFDELVAGPEKMADTDPSGKRPPTAYSQVCQFLLCAYVPLQVTMVIWALWLFPQDHLSWFERGGLLWSTGLTTGAVGITAAHELVHRPRRFDRFLGLTLLACVTYMHFRIEHVFGHHKHVATPRDPASARQGENLYRFWVRTLIGSFTSAWNIEASRMLARNRPLLSPQNRMVQYLAIQGAIYFAIALIWGWMGILLFLSQSLIAAFLLETINYVEHYGLAREKRGEGYEPVGAQHSWDSRHRLTNWFLFNLGHHADHHREPLQPYDRIQVLQNSSKLPFGYSFSLLLTVVPPLWFKLMDPHVERARATAGRIRAS